MNRVLKFSLAGSILILFTVAALSWDGTVPLIVDHTCTDLSVIPLDMIDSVQAEMRLHYAHTSHGSQLTHGLDAIEQNDATYDVSIGESSLPGDEGSFCIFRGQESITYIDSDYYWSTAAGMNMTRAVLNNNPEINISMFAWCTQMDIATEAYVEAYFDSMRVLELEFPHVTFVYITGNAQSTYSAANRYARNQQIRQYCSDNNKVLFDFAELDCWWFNPDMQEWELHTFEDTSGNIYPLQHPQFAQDVIAHTTWESCEQKGRALWWMMAELSGWPDTTGVEQCTWGSIKRRSR